MKVGATKFGTIALPLALLSACGGSGDQESASPSSTPTAAPSPIETAPIETTPTEAAPAAATSPAAGAVPVAFATCRTCHSTQAGVNGVGPTLFGIIGSKAGEVPGYTFSAALKNSGIVWNPEKLDTWLQNPTKMVPGTKMVQTVPDAAKRKEIIDYLETLK